MLNNYYTIFIDLSQDWISNYISKHNSTQLVKSTMKRDITARKLSSGLIIHTNSVSGFVNGCLNGLCELRFPGE